MEKNKTKKQEEEKVKGFERSITFGKYLKNSLTKVLLYYVCIPFVKCFLGNN